MSDIIYRSETIADYSGIAGLVYDAFMDWRQADYKVEPLVVDFLRHCPLFDPDLSLVAERDGCLVGHALFTPFEFIVMGSRQRGLVLAPLCVAPPWQRQGVGEALMRRGHEIAQSKGYVLSILCGHPSYYPRFGYLQRMFSLSGCQVHLEAECSGGVDGISGCYQERPVLSADMPWITELWMERHSADSLALYPGECISQWFNHTQHGHASVILQGRQPTAYVRYRASDPLAVKELLVKGDQAGPLLSWLLAKHHHRTTGDLSLTLSEEAAQALLAGYEGASVTPDRHASEAFMLKVLDEQNQAVAEYCAAVQSGALEPGIINFPATLDIDG